MLKCFFILIVTLFFISCGDKNSDTTDNRSSANEKSESDEDTAMTPEEMFSSAIVQDMLGLEEDIDLQVYLEDEIFPMLSAAGKVTFDRVSSSMYLLSFQESGAEKNFLIKKYYDPQNNEIKFEKAEIQLRPEDQFLK